MTEKVKITFLGTAGSMPSANRNPTSILLSYNQENILIDCGEGTQRQMRKAKINPCKINKVLITHWHGDHIFGLPGLFQTLVLSGYNREMQIFGPPGTKDFLKNFIGIFVPVFKFSADSKEVSSGKFFEDKDFYLEAEKMTHGGTKCNAYSFVIKDKIRIDKKKLKKSKIPAGPLLQKISQGKDVVYKGKKFKSKNLTYVEKGRKISFVLDTSINSKISKFVKDADLLIIESTLEESLEKLAKEHGHLTSKQASEIAKKAKVKRLIITHLSPRYEKSSEKILAEAKKVFKKTELVRDFDVLEL